jgi:uncharacterized protein (DUF1501 family)
MADMTTRRAFLRNLIFAQSPAVTDPGARTLVCIFLRGGADTLNMLVPYGDDNYYRNRPTLAIPRPSASASSALKLNDFYGLHPKLKPLVPLFGEGRLGFVQAVGSDNPTGSHFETQDQIEHGEAYGRSVGGGWLGRHLRARVHPAVASGALSAVAIGAALPESLRGAPAASAFSSLDEIQLPRSSGQASVIARALSDLYATEVGILAEQGEQTLRLLSRVETLRGQPYVPHPGADYAADGFGPALREIARIVKADLGLEVACVDLGGWDTHFFQGSPVAGQAGPIESLARGLAAFDADLAGYRDRVTTIVMTEFGRRLYENGSAGTDHGRGFAFFALGEQINGGIIHGEWPGLKEEPSLPGPGGMDVRFDYRSVLAEVLTHATSGAQISKVFPDFAPQKIGICRSPTRSALL